MMRDGNTSLSDGRMWSFEYLRILAAFGIVWFHNGAAPLHWLGLAGLPVFLLISFSLLARTVPDAPLAVFATARARRVLLPWLFWSAVYLVLGLLRQWRHGTPFFEPWMVLTGFSLHLWYLPYLFAVSAVLYWVRLMSPAADGPAGVAVCAALAMAILTANAVWLSGMPPFDQWLTAVPMTLFGHALGRIALIHVDQTRRSAVAAVLAMVTAACAARLFIPGGYGQDAVVAWLGLTLFVAVGALPLPASAAVRLLAPLTLGIYLIHPLVMDMFSRLIGESGSPLRVVLVFCASAAVVNGMKKLPMMRRVV